MLKQYFNIVLLGLVMAGCASSPEAPAPGAIPVSSDAPKQVATESISVIDGQRAPSLSVPVSTRAPDPALSAALKSLNDLAITSMNAKQYESALGGFANVRAKMTTYAPAYLNAAVILRNQKKISEAMAMLDACLGAVAGDPRALTFKALLLREQGKLVEAKTQYLAAVTSDPAYAPAHRNLAVLADVYLNEPALALRHMEQYGLLQPDDKDVENWLIEMRRRVQSSNASGGAP